MSKECLKCHVIKNDDEFYKAKKGKNGLDSYCKPCRKEHNHQVYENDKDHVLTRTKAWKLANRETYLPQQNEAAKIRSQTQKGKFTQYKSSAKSRDLDFELTLEEFSDFWQNPCTYCGDPIETIGLDRIDSDSGYTLDNICSCCETCNKGKMALSESEFLALCVRVYNKFKDEYEEKQNENLQ